MFKSFLSMMFAFMFLSLPQSVLAAKSYTFDKDHTYVTWYVSHFGYSDITGKVLATGTLMFDEKNPEKSKLNVTVPINTMTTAIKKLDERLQGRSYFDQSQFPNATFVSESIKQTGKNTGTISGVLTIRNISKPLVLNVTLNKHGKHPIYNRDTLGFTATAEIKRSDFAIRAYIPGVSDEVKLIVDAEAILDKEKEANSTND